MILRSDNKAEIKTPVRMKHYNKIKINITAWGENAAFIYIPLFKVLTQFRSGPTYSTILYA